MNSLASLIGNVINLDDRKIKATPVSKIKAPDIPKRERNYCVLPARACRDQRINKTAAFVVLATLCQYTNRHGETYVGQKRLGEDLQVSHQAISKQLKILIDLGYIERLQKGNKDFSAKHRVIFDSNLTLDEVKSRTPPRLREDNTDAPTLSKEEAAERLKQIKARLKQPKSTQPQKLNDDGISTQPLELRNQLQDQRNLEGGSTQPGGHLNATTKVARREVESNKKEEAFDRWMQK